MWMSTNLLVIAGQKHALHSCLLQVNHQQSREARVLYILQYISFVAYTQVDLHPPPVLLVMLGLC